LVGPDKIAFQWASAATMATRYAKGLLLDPRGEIVEPNRQRRLRFVEATTTNEIVDLESPDSDDEI
jgi:hypothetical protein